MPDVGALVRSTTGGWMVLPPQSCPAGHDLAPGRVVVRYRPCVAHGGHTVWECECGGLVGVPALGEGCDAAGPGRVRVL